MATTSTLAESRLGSGPGKRLQHEDDIICGLAIWAQPPPPARDQLNAMQSRSASLHVPELYVVKRDNVDCAVAVLQRRPNEVYVHYANTDRRLDEWIPETALMHALEDVEDESAQEPSRGTKRKRQSSAKLSSQSPCPSPTSSSGGLNGTIIANAEELGQSHPDEFDEDANEHRLLTARRNFDKVCFGQWQMKTWYFSPYPVSESDDPSHMHTSSAAPTSSSSQSFPSATSRTKIQGLARTTLRSHGRTADLVAGGLGRENTVSSTGHRDAILWVCDRCFKYMREGSVWELHMKSCDMKHPPGRKVYQRGAHIIWEVDGAKQKLYCQNLSLFGKLFIDIKTLFFDCDNFMFYILTDADSQRDHVLGFFSKEKVSYDDFNLACIVILPPYQKKGYGMLLIEFSYELSRRAHKLGTPERPLSDLGLRGYLAYWTAVLVRFFRHLLGTEEQDPSGGSPGNGEIRTPRGVKKKRVKGFEGEVAAAEADRAGVSAAAVSLIEGDSFGSLRTTHTVKDPSTGKSATHVSIKCTLLDIAHATHLRPEDVAFTLAECGLLTRRKDVIKDEGAVEEEIVVSREMVEAVAKERGVKRMCMDRAHVLL